MSSTTALPYTQTRLIRFAVDEPYNVPLFDVGSNVRDFAELMDLALLNAVGSLDIWTSNPSWREIEVSRITYGSPFIIDAQVINESIVVARNIGMSVAAVGGVLWSIQRLVKSGAESYLRFEEARKVRAERKSVEGDERRKQSEWESKQSRFQQQAERREDRAHLRALLNEADVEGPIRSTFEMIDREAETAEEVIGPTALSEKYDYLTHVLVRQAKKENSSLRIDE